MKNVFICYPKCGTCKKAQKFLENNNIEYQIRDIKENTPTKEELKNWSEQNNLPLKKFFNTSGLVYKNLNLKEKLSSMSDEEKLELLSSNGMLIKRPIIVNNQKVLIGFKEEEWKELK